MDWYDSHSHLDADEFDVDRGAVLARAHAAGVRRQLVPAVARPGWEKLRDLCESEAGLAAAYGLHPMYLQAHRPEHLEDLQTWITRKRPAAIGECGLDFYVEGLDPERQRFFFHRQLEIARDARLPVVLHARRAVDEVIAALRRVGGLTGVVHSFSGSEEQARQLYALGFCLGIGGPVTYERARRLRGLVARMPVDFLLLETDAPDQPDAGHRGLRNEPARLPVVAEAVAALRGTPLDALARATTANALRLFGQLEAGAGAIAGP